MIFLIDILFYVWAIFSGGLSMFLLTFIALFCAKFTLTYIKIYKFLIKSSEYNSLDYCFLSRAIVIPVIFLIIFLIPNYHFELLNKYIVFIKVWSGFMIIPLMDYLLFTFKYLKNKI